MSDAEIAQALAPVVDGDLTVPYPGVWARAPYASHNGRAVIAADPGLSSIVVERGSGAVMLVGSDGESLVNRSVEAFVACARSYTAAVNTPIGDSGSDSGSGADTDDDDAWEAVGDRLIEEIRGIDPQAAADETFWSVAAEEVGYGMSAPDVHDRPATGPATGTATAHEAMSPEPAVAAAAEPAKRLLLLSMSDERRGETFTSDQWRRLSSAARVAVAPPLPQLVGALELMADIASQRGEPAPQPEILVCADSGDELSQAVAAGLLDRLPSLRYICRLTSTQSAAGGATRAANVPVFSFGGENAAQQVISIIASRVGN